MIFFFSLLPSIISLSKIGRVQQYIDMEHSDRSTHTNVIVKVHQGFEPRTFKKVFPTWRNELWEVSE